MSRIGKKPVVIPANVTVNVAEGNVVTVKGPKGELTNTFNADMIINVEGNVLTVSRPTDEANHRALHGLTRTLIANMVEGVEKGFAKELEVNGVGYRAEKKGNKLVMRLGFSTRMNLATCSPKSMWKFSLLRQTSPLLRRQSPKQCLRALSVTFRARMTQKTRRSSK